MERDKEKDARRQSTLGALTASSSSSKPPLSLPSTSHLDPNAYVRGSHQITLGNHVVVHPRAHVYSDQGPITIDDKCLISEKCIVGATSSKSDPTVAFEPSSSNTDPNPKTGDEAAPIHISHSSHLHPAVILHAPCHVSAYAVLESNVTLLPNVTIGMHSKICANITIASGTVIPDFTVVYGDSDSGLRRRRICTDASKGEGGKTQLDLAEEGRLKGFEREREGAMILLRQTAARGLGAGGGGSRRGKQ